MFHSKRTVVAMVLFLLWLCVWTVREYRRSENPLLSEVGRRLSQCFGRLLKSPETWGIAFVYFCGLLFGRAYITMAVVNGAHFYTQTMGEPFSTWASGNLLGVVAGLLYGIFRLGCARTVSAVLTILVITSPIQLYILGSAADHDYFRALFTLAVIFGTGFLIRSENSQRTTIWLSALIGLTCGVGGWFRSELRMFFFPSTLAILFLMPKAGDRPLRKRLFGTAALGLGFLVTAPRPYFGINSTHQVAGYMLPFDASLGLTRPAYDVGHLFLDEYIDANNALMTHSTGYREPDRSFFSTYLYVLPADFLARIYASGLRILSLPFRYQLPPLGMSSPIVERAYVMRAAIQQAFQPLMLLLALATFIGLAALSPRYAIFYLCWVCFLCALFTAQFFTRHHFYAEFLSWWNVGFLGQALWLAARLKRSLSRETLRPSLWSRLAWAGAGSGLLILVGWGTLAQLRFVQRRNLGVLFAEYLKAETENVDLSALRKVAVDSATERKVAFGKYLGSEPQFFVAEFGGPTCPPSTIWPVFRYLPIETEYLKRLDWSRTLRVDLPRDTRTVLLFFPAWQGFVGVKLPAQHTGCLQSLKRISNPEKLKLLLTATLPSAIHPGYQALDDLSLRRTLWGTTASVVEAFSRWHFTQIEKDDLDFRAPIIDISGARWTISGYAQLPVDPHMFIHRDRTRSRLAALWSADVNPADVDTDLLISKPLSLKKGSLIYVEGNLEVGGIRIGAITQGRTAGAVAVTSPGPFIALLEIQEDGDYLVGIANHLSAYNSLENRLVITRIGYYEYGPPDISIDEPLRRLHERVEKQAPERRGSTHFKTMDHFGQSPTCHREPRRDRVDSAMSQPVKPRTLGQGIQPTGRVELHVLLSVHRRRQPQSVQRPLDHRPQAGQVRCRNHQPSARLEQPVKGEEHGGRLVLVDVLDHFQKCDLVGTAVRKFECIDEPEPELEIG